jgi:hypothetical protein
MFVPDYTMDMFHQDHDEVLPIFMHYKSLENPIGNQEQSNAEKVVTEVFNYFIKKYGKAKGTDYELRFLSINQFIEHYQKDLLREGLISAESSESIQVHNNLLEALLNSFRSPQPPSPLPSSSLFNEDHELNYKKVIRIMKAGAKN